MTLKEASDSAMSEEIPSAGTHTSHSDSPSQDEDRPRLDNPSLYVNRELSLLAFQWRVLEEAQDQSNPLLERFKFLSIVGSNLDEFFMVRVAGLKRQLEAGNARVGIDGLTPSVQLEAIRTEIIQLYDRAHQCLKDELLPALDHNDIHIVKFATLDDQRKEQVKEYFLQNIFPVLTPLGFDPAHPFPHISNLSLNLAVLIRGKDGHDRFARLKIPDTLPQLICVDGPITPANKHSGRQSSFMWLDEVIGANLDILFAGMEVLEAHPFHITRDAEMEIQEWEAGDLLETTEEGIRQRRFGDVVRLIVDHQMPSKILDILIHNLEIDQSDVYMVEGRIPLSVLRYIGSLDRPDLKYPPFLPAIPAVLNPDSQEDDIFTAIRKRDILLHHPYDSFSPMVKFLTQAARDPAVLAIKMTLYRVGQNSPVVEALLDAMEHGKQVAVLVELKARFDERSNIEWARALEREGVHVVYGLLGLKIHSKVAMVVRKESDQIRRYLHIGTGNYNPVTAHLYTDLGIFTANEAIASDVTDLFNYLTGYSEKQNFRKLLVSPINLRERFESLIRREIEQHKRGKEGRLIFKTNSLVDDRIIKLLYEAAQAGVKVDLIVRGICCLRPDIPKISENIRVISIVGRFLEHSRIYYFHNGGDEEIFIGSADMMPRNLDRRVEVLTPVEDPRLARFLREEVLTTYLADNIKARYMQADGSYVRNFVPGDKPISSQTAFVGRKITREWEKP